MKITQFKNSLATHGADLGRWEADPAEVRAFMNSSAEAQALYKEAERLDRALNSFTVDAIDPALLDRVMHRIGGKPEAAPAATVHRFEPRKKFVMPPPVFWGGAAACAAAIALFVSSLGVPDVPVPEQQATVVAEAAKAPAAEGMDVLLAELAEEEIVAQEIIALLDSAEAAVPEEQAPGAPATEAEVDAFLDELFAREGEEDPALQQEMDLWDLFLEGETREL